MNLVDEEDVALFERRQDADEILGLLQRRSAGRAKVRAELARDESGQRRLAEARRTVEQHVLERFAAPLGGVDRDAQIFDDPFLPDVFVERARPKARAVELVFDRVRGSTMRGRSGAAADRCCDVLRAQQTSARLGLAHAELFAALLRYISASRPFGVAIDASASSVSRIIASPSVRL